MLFSSTDYKLCHGADEREIHCRRESGRNLNLDPFFPGTNARARAQLYEKVRLNKEIVIQKSCKLEKTSSPSVDRYFEGTKGLTRSSFHFVRLTFIRFVQVRSEFLCNIPRSSSITTLEHDCESLGSSIRVLLGNKCACNCTLVKPLRQELSNTDSITLIARATSELSVDFLFSFLLLLSNLYYHRY